MCDYELTACDYELTAELDMTADGYWICPCCGEAYSEKAEAESCFQEHFR